MAIIPEIAGLSRILAPLFGQQEEEDILPPYDAARRTNELATPEHAYVDRLNQHIDAMPQRQPPSMLRKIVASVAGLQGPSAAEQQERIMYGDYGRQLGDWQTKLNPLVQAANFERQANSNERMMANQIVSGEMRDRSLQRQLARDKTLEKQGNERISQSARRVEQADERIKIAEAAAKGGTIDWGSNTIVYKDGTTAKINADLFTTQEKMELQQKYAKERITQQNESKPNRVRTEVIDDPDNPGKRILVTVDLDTQEVKPATFKRDTGEKARVTPTVRTEETQANKDRVITARALRIRAQDPVLGRYVTIKNGRFEGIIKPGWISGPSADNYRKLYKLIYGEDPTDIPQGTNVVPPAAGRVRVTRINPTTGKEETGSIPASQLEQALKAGYKQIQ